MGGGNMNTTDLDARLSYVSSTHMKNQESYLDGKTPDGLNGDVEEGALRAGGAPNMWSKENVGVVVQYCAVGMYDMFLQGSMYPLFMNYLNTSPSVNTSANALVKIAWSFKVFYGLLTDMFPIAGYRRRPYMLLGWVIAISAMFVLGFMPLGESYWGPEHLKLRHVMAKTKPSTWTDEQRSHLNPGAADSGGKYVILMMTVAFGYLMSDVAADGILVELAQREPEEIRGKTQTLAYMMRNGFSAFATFVVAIFMNSEQYGGDFSFHISFPTLCLMFAVAALPVLPMTWFYIHEERAGFIDRPKYMSELWDFCCTRAVYQNLVYKFVSGIFMNFSIIESQAMMTYWAQVKTFNNQMFNVVGQVIFVLALKVTSKWGLHWDWRIMIAVTQVAVVALDSVCTLFTTWDIVRNQWFYLGDPIVQQVPYGINFIVSSFVTVELINAGSEGAAYGLMTTVNNLTAPVATVLYQMVDRKFDVTNERIQEDDHAVRMDVTWTLLIMYSMNLLSIVWLFLLPRQKAETREMKLHGGSSKLLGGSILVFMALALAYSVFYNIMQIFPETSCMKIVGGEGC